MANTGAAAARTSTVSAGNIVAWILCVLVAAEFLFVSGLKFIANPMEVQVFAGVGLGQWFRYFTAVLELLGAIGLLFPKRSRRSALLLALVMLGAITAHLTALRHTEFSSPLVPIVTLVVLIVIVRLRRDVAR
jgi:putative oxidoreductase